MKAGLQGPRSSTSTPHTLDYDPARLAATDFSRVLAIVATNLYGLPERPAGARRHSPATHGVFLIDDAAQAMGATVGGRRSGTWGDAGLFSFDKGKNVSAIDGGVLTVTRRRPRGGPRPRSGRTAQPAGADLGRAHRQGPGLRGAAAAVALRDGPTRIPQLELGKTVFTTDFPLDGPDPALAALAATMLPRLDAFTAARRANAAAYLERLAAIPGIRTIAPVATAAPVYLRLPVLCATESAKQRAIAALTAAGIGASGSYPASLADVREVQAVMAAGPVSAEGGREVARCIVTLPTHPYVTISDIDRAVDVLAGASAERLGENH